MPNTPSHVMPNMPRKSPSLCPSLSSQFKFLCRLQTFRDTPPWFFTTIAFPPLILLMTPPLLIVWMMLLSMMAATTRLPLPTLVRTPLLLPCCRHLRMTLCNGVFLLLTPFLSVDTSDGESDGTSSDASSISVISGDSYLCVPHTLKSSTRSTNGSVNNVPLVTDRSMAGPVMNLHLGTPESGHVSGSSRTSQSIVTRSFTTAVKSHKLLRPAKGANDGEGIVSGFPAKHKKIAQQRYTGTSSVAIPPQMMDCLNKTERKQIKLLLRNKPPAMYYAWAEEHNKSPKSAGNIWR